LTPASAHGDRCDVERHVSLRLGPRGLRPGARPSDSRLGRCDHRLVVVEREDWLAEPDGDIGGADNSRQAFDQPARITVEDVDRYRPSACRRHRAIAGRAGRRESAWLAPRLMGSRPLLDALDEDDCTQLASRVAPYLRESLDQTSDHQGEEWLNTRRAAKYLGITARPPQAHLRGDHPI
jgi:hypothetical protein